MQALTLVIGYGNPLCGDDGAGPLVVQQLTAELAAIDDRRAVTCLAVFQLTPELADDVAQMDAVIFVDAARGDAPGQIDCRELSAAQSEATTSAFTHQVSPSALLGSAADLYGKYPAAYLYTITGRNFEIGEPVSAEVEAALPTLLAELRTHVTLKPAS